MEYVADLESGSSPRIRKAAKAILRKGLSGYCPHLLDALNREIANPGAWKTQCQLIKAIAISECADALPTLRRLLDRDYTSTVLYRELAFAVFVIENAAEMNLRFLHESIAKGNVSQISGACSGLLFKKTIPATGEIRTILEGISGYTENEGATLTPRCYIAAVAHLWPKEETRGFLESCKESSWNGLVEIAENALQGKRSPFTLV